MHSFRYLSSPPVGDLSSYPGLQPSPMPPRPPQAPSQTEKFIAQSIKYRMGHISDSEFTNCLKSHFPLIEQFPKAHLDIVIGFPKCANPLRNLYQREEIEVRPSQNGHATAHRTEFESGLFAETAKNSSNIVTSNSNQTSKTVENHFQISNQNSVQNQNSNVQTPLIQTPNGNFDNLLSNSFWGIKTRPKFAQNPSSNAQEQRQKDSENQTEDQKTDFFSKKYVFRKNAPSSENEEEEEKIEEADQLHPEELKQNRSKAEGSDCSNEFMKLFETKIRKIRYYWRNPCLHYPYTYKKKFAQCKRVGLEREILCFVEKVDFSKKMIQPNLNGKE